MKVFFAGVIAVSILALLPPAIAFTPIPTTPLVGKLPVIEQERSYDIKQLLEDQGIQAEDVSEFLVYVFFTGLGGGNKASRAFYEIYTESPEGEKYSQFMNAVFDQPDTVINSANLWIPYDNVADPGKLHARKIDMNYKHKLADIQVVMKSAEYNNLDEAMTAYVEGTDTVFRDIYLIGYR